MCCSSYYKRITKGSAGGQLLPETALEGGNAGGGKQNTQMLKNDKELTSFRKLTNWSTVK